MSIEFARTEEDDAYYRIEANDQLISDILERQDLTEESTLFVETLRAVMEVDGSEYESPTIGHMLEVEAAIEIQKAHEHDNARVL